MPHFRDTLLVALVLLISTLIPLAASVTQLTGVYQVDMNDLTHFYRLYVTGHETAVRAGSDMLEYRMLYSGVIGSNGYSIFTRLSNYNMAMIGPAGTSLTYDLYKTSVCVLQHDFIAFGPVAQTSDFEPPKPSYEKYIPQILWTMPSEQAQAMALLVRLAERDLFPFRQTFHRTMTLSIGAASQSLYKLVAPKFFCSMRYAVSEHAFNAEDYKKGITDYQPGIVYLYNYAGNSGWNDRLITDTTLISMNSTIATTFEQYYALFMVWQTRATTGHTVLPPDNFLVTSPVPGGDATEYAATQDFLTQAADWFRPLMYNYDLLSMMAGWASGTALMQALNKYTGRYVNNRGSFYNRMYDSQNSYVVSDLFIGTHGEGRKTCSSEAAKQGMLCNCNHAGNNIWLQRFAKGRYGHDITSDGGRVFQFGLGKCANLVPPRADRPSAIPYNELVQTPVPIHVAGISPIDDPMIENLCKQAHDVISRLSNTELYQHESTHAYRGYCVPAKVSNMAYQITVHSNRFVMNSMMGVIPESIETPRSLVLDYIPQVTQPHKSEYNLVYLFPTLEQELYVLASYLRGEVKGSSVVCAAVKDSTVSDNIVSILKKTLKTFDVKWTHVVTPKTNLGSSIPASCTHTFVVGVGEEDAAGLVKYLKTNTKSVVFASFDDLTKYYSSFAPLLNTAGAAVTDRFVFATNLPSWTGTRSNPSAAAASRPLSTVEHFLQSVPAELHTPAALRAYVVAMLYDKLSAGREPSTGNMEALLYGKVSWTVAGIKFGPFTGVCMDMTSTNKTSCVYNYGARSISVWSYTRVVWPEAAVLQHPLNPSMVYESRGARANLQSRDSIGLAMEECIEVMQSSELILSTTINPQVDTSATLHRSDEALDKMLIFMFVCLCIAVFVIVVMLMIKFGVLRSYACTVGWCGGKMKDDGGASALQMREKQQADILELQRDAQDVRRAPAGDGGLPLTFVCVDIVHFRELWVNAPELMSSTVAKYQHHVRQSIVRHDCYEMKAADGLFMIACGSADAGVSVARSCVEACFSGTRDAAAVDKVYAALGFGCGVLGSGGLRLRIAMHHGTACRTPGLTGQAVVRWSGGAVDDTVRAACFSRNSWQICVTECARRKLSSTNTLFLDPLGTVSLPHKGRTEIFAIREKKHSGASRVPIVAGSYSQLLRRLVDSADYRNVVASTLCRQHFASFLSCCCWDHDSLYLTAVAHCLGLPALDIDDYVDERTYTAALLRSVSGRLGALLECRHSVWSDAADREHQSGVSYSASVESSVYCLAVADSGSSAKVCKYK